MRYLSLYVFSFVFFCLIDWLFLKFVMGPLYIEAYPHLLRMESGVFQVNLYAALACYLLIVFSVLYFINPLVAAGSWSSIVLTGFVLGVALYGVFDLTNMAILSQWNIWISLFEILWGGVICSLTGVFFSICARHW